MAFNQVKIKSMKQSAWYGRDHQLNGNCKSERLANGDQLSGFQLSGKRAHGDRFENEAQRFLEANQYRVIAKNVNYPCGEIDLIAEAGEGRGLTLVFVEVRKRDPRSWIRPEETITYPKQRTLKNAITRYLLSYSGQAKHLRIDLLAFDGTETRHFQDFIRY